MHLAILQARMSSTRSAGQSIKTPAWQTHAGPPGGTDSPRQTHRQSHHCHKSSQPSDDAVEQACRQMDIECFRGSLGQCT